MTAPVDDRQVLETARTWLAEGDRVVLAMVVAVEGSSPRGLGAVMAVREDGLFVGSVSGGCVEAGVIAAAQEMVDDETVRPMAFPGGGDGGRSVGLHCGGGLTIALFRPERDLLDRLANLQAERRAAALVVDLASGSQAVVDETNAAGPIALAPAAMADVRRRLVTGESGAVEGGLFARVEAPPPALVIVGAVHVTQALAAMARMVGFHVTVIDPRRSFATPERFPGVELVVRQPETALADLVLDRRTAVVALAHVAVIDDAALAAALASDAFYVGALGSTKTHAKRCNRLAALGVPPAALARIHAPVGLDIGAADAGEIAVSVLAQIIAARRGKPSQRSR
ncbi:MAG: XdhC family protein [Solirubrobacterales bacterium]